MNSATKSERWIKTVSVAVSILSVAAGIGWAGLQAGATLKSLAVETDVKVMQIYVTELLPHISGIQATRLSQSCFEGELQKSKADNKELNRELLDEMSTKCTFSLFGERGKQVASYWAALELALRYPVLCKTAKKTLESKSITFPDGNVDEDLVHVLKELDKCQQTVVSGSWWKFVFGVAPGPATEG